MKSNSLLLNTLLLAAPLALGLPGPALAQAERGTNTPPPAQDAGTAAPTLQDNVEFYFPGGVPAQFLSAVDFQYKVDWRKVADIPQSMQFVHIPALRMNRQSSERILGPTNNFPFGGLGGRRGGAPEDRNPLHALISLYNSMGRAKPELGNLLVEGDLQKPSIVMFHSTNSSAGSPFQMKALALNGIPTNEWKNLEAGLESDLSAMARNQGSADWPSTFFVILHQDTGLLVVTGPDSILQAAESFVNACHANHPGATPNPNQPPPEVHTGPVPPPTGQK